MNENTLPSILQDFTKEDEAYTVDTVTNFLDENVKTYVIQGHGLEYSGKDSKHFILPEGCFVIAAMHPGKTMSATSSDYIKRINSLCSMPLKIITDGIRYERSIKDKDRIVELILNRDKEILQHLGPITIYRPGEKCPNFYYGLVSYLAPNVKNLNAKKHMFGFTKYGSGITHIKQYRRSKYCYNPKKSIQQFLFNPVYTKTDTLEDIVHKTREFLF